MYLSDGEVYLKRDRANQIGKIGTEKSARSSNDCIVFSGRISTLLGAVDACVMFDIHTCKHCLIKQYTAVDTSRICSTKPKTPNKPIRVFQRLRGSERLSVKRDRSDCIN